MQIQCPACATRYFVPDSAIGHEGRRVRCAKCRHNWFQEGLPAPSEGQDVPAALPANADLAQAREAAVPVSPPPPAPPPPPPASVAPDPDLPPALPVIERIRPAEPQLPDASPFDAGPPFRPRRNWLKIWTWAAGIFALFAVGIIFAVSYWGLPDWVPVTRPDFAAAQPDLQLDFPIDQQEKREMPGGQEYFAINGTITNVGSTTRKVPSILVILRDARERKVFEREIVPEKTTLAPGESVNVTRAVLDVPLSARFAEIGWKAQ
ncbi:MJ0042-type zinc finger domain-containing protein [Altererythrobacter lauratis]|uniref:MJ0042-type zinc finger domain-containing protein n=1 Tax=Alteraurantiacibacter lauratis TaxID=2054627 RepID=A0ABV7EF65_9SPHN